MAQGINEEAVRPSISQSRSHGRGGAGNVSSKPSPAPDAKDFATPHLKSSTFTTGRGGAGNMLKSDPANPNAARLAQDVETPAAHSKNMEGTYHWGRGGEGNMTTVGGEKKDKEALTRVKSRSKERGDGKERSGSMKTVLDKGREMLGLGGKKERTAASEKAGESAIE